MTTLNIESLRVESFATSETAGTLGPQGVEGYEQALFMPITAHTDPCDVCCQQN